MFRKKMSQESLYFRLYIANQHILLDKMPEKINKYKENNCLLSLQLSNSEKSSFFINRKKRAVNNFIQLTMHEKAYFVSNVIVI